MRFTTQLRPFLPCPHCGAPLEARPECGVALWINPLSPATQRPRVVKVELAGVDILPSLVGIPELRRPGHEGDTVKEPHELLEGNNRFVFLPVPAFWDIWQEHKDCCLKPGGVRVYKRARYSERTGPWWAEIRQTRAWIYTSPEKQP